MTMNVKPRLAQIELADTDHSAVPSFCSRPGVWPPPPIQLATIPTFGLRRKNHITEATATLVATVLEKIVRNAPTPRRYLSARTASPTPSASPIGTVISAYLNVTTSESWNSLLRKASTYCFQPVV